MPTRLTPDQKLELLNDQWLRENPANLMSILQKLDPEDGVWLRDAVAGDRAPNVPLLMKHGLDATAQYVRQHPAESGAIAGGLASAPFTGGMSIPAAMTTAGLFGVGGANLGMLASAGLDPNSPVPRTSMGVATEGVKQGAIQAGGEGVGQVFGAAMRGTGNRLMDTAIGSQAKIRSEFPDVNLAETLNRNAILPTTKKFGVERSAGLRRASGAETQRLADNAGQRGVTITRNDVQPALAPSSKMAAEDAQAGMPGGQARIDAQVDHLFDAQFPYGDIPADQAPAVTRAIQRKGRAARAASNAGDLPRGIDAAASDDLASGVRQAANRKIGPEYEASNARTQSLIAANKVTRKVSRQPLTLPSLKATAIGGATSGVGALSGDPLTGLAVGAVPMALSVPQISAPIAIALYQAGRLPFDMLVQTIGPAAVRAAGITK